jgi:[ribosomal protein S18]-alanine N-acetyltransferase
MINPRPDFAITAAMLVDIDAIDRIEQEAFNTPWSRDLLRAAILNDAYRVRILRTEDMGPIGFSIAHAMRGRSNLDNLAVERSTRGRGYGSQLIQDWIDEASSRQLESLSLQVNTANVRAQRLYEQFRFRTSKLLVAYYPNGDDAYQMERALTPHPEPGVRQSGRGWLHSRRRWALGPR